MLISVLIQRWWKKGPRIIYKFFSSFGISTILDFLLIGFVDFCYKNFTYGEMFKLFNFYVKYAENYFLGIFITIIIYLLIGIINLFLYYTYIVFLHN